MFTELESIYVLLVNLYILIDCCFKMDNASFETQVWISDEESKLSFSVAGNGSQQSSAESEEQVLEGYGKAPRFGRRRYSHQEAVNEKNEGGFDENSFGAGQPISEIGGSPQREGVSRSSQDMEIPSFDSKDKMHWFIEYKRGRALNKKLRALNKKLMKILERKNIIIKEISKEVKVLSDILSI